MESSAQTATAALNEGSSPPLVVRGDLERMAALVLGSVVTIFPPGAQCGMLHRLSRTTGAMWHVTNGESVRRVRRHLQLLFGDQASRRLEPLVRDQLALASLNALFISLLPSLKGEHLSRVLPVEGLHYLEELQRQDKPILLLGAHYGIYGYAVAALLSAHGYPTCLVGYGSSHSPPPQASHLYNRLYWPRVQELSQRIRMVTVNPGVDLAPELGRILERRAEVFYLLADQYFITRPGEDHLAHLVPLQFLDETVYVDVRVVQLAKERGAEPLTAIPASAEPLQSVLIEPMQWASTGTTREDVAQDLQVYIARLERRLLEYPALWRDLRRPDLLPRMGRFDMSEPDVKEPELLPDGPRGLSESVEWDDADPPNASSESAVREADVER